MLLVSLYGCSQSNPQTVVTLHHIEASSLQEALTKSLGPDIKFSVTENKIVIFEAVANITPTLELLKSLDESPSIVKLHFRRLKQYGYSTIENPEPFSIKENQETEIVVNNEKLHVIFKRASMNTFIFKMMTKKNRRVNKFVFEINRVFN